METKTGTQEVSRYINQFLFSLKKQNPGPYIDCISEIGFLEVQCLVSMYKMFCLPCVSELTESV